MLRRLMSDRQTDRQTETKRDRKGKNTDTVRPVFLFGFDLNSSNSYSALFCNRSEVCECFQIMNEILPKKKKKKYLRHPDPLERKQFCRKLSASHLPDPLTKNTTNHKLLIHKKCCCLTPVIFAVLYKQLTTKKTNIYVHFIEQNLNIVFYHKNNIQQTVIVYSELLWPSGKALGW